MSFTGSTSPTATPKSVNGPADRKATPSRSNPFGVSPQIAPLFDNALGGSLHGVERDGLTPFGRKMVSTIDARGGIIDVAHSSPAVVEDVLDLVEGPVVLSHTGIQGACDSRRNLPGAGQ